MLISVVTVCLNDFEGVKKTHDSLFRCEETSKFIEWIVVDGGSIDGTLQFLENNKDRLTYVSETDEGLYDAMNKGIERCNGVFVIFINAGDELILTQSVTEFLSINHPAIILCDANLIYPLGSRVRRSKEVSYIRHSNPTIHQAIFFPLCDLINFRYSLSLVICGDYALLCDMYMKNIAFKICHQPVCNFFIGGISTMNFGQLLREAFTIQRDILGLSLSYRIVSLIKRCFSVLATYIYYRYSHMLGLK